MKPNHAHRLGSLVAVLALLLAGQGPARADVVTYKDGKIVKGIAEEMPGNPEFIAFSNEMGRITIPKTRIQGIKKESKAQGYLEISQALLGKSRFDDALLKTQQALELEPANAAALQLKSEIQVKQAAQMSKERADAIGQIDKLGVKARELIQKGDFAGADKLLVDANKLVPSPEQKKRLAGLISDMYLAWADERADKLDLIGAEDRLNKALAANPNNDRVIEKMLKLWEKDPQKRGDTARVYETILQRHPEDKALELTLANIYYEMGNRAEDAIRHYLNLFKGNEDYRGTEVERRLIESLDKLQRQYAAKRQFEQAIKYFDVLAVLAPQRANPTDKIYYLFYQKGQGVKPEDYPARLELANYARLNGLQQEALDQYHSLAKVEVPEVQAAALQGITLFANAGLQNAQMQFEKGNYSLAKSMADSLKKEFPEVQDIKEPVAELIGKAQAEEIKEQRNRRQLAQAVLARAEEFYQTAYFHYQNLFSTQRNNLPVLISDRTNAINYFQYAIDAYQEALRIDPSLGTETNAIVNVKLAQAKELVLRLNSRPTWTINRPNATLPIN